MAKNNNTLSSNKRKNQRRSDAKRKYGLTLEGADILRQECSCEICGVKAKKMVIDHVVEGSYRGVLCQQCNTRLGWYEKRKHEILYYVA